MTTPLIGALRYSDGAYPERIMARVARALQAEDVPLAGVLERPVEGAADRLRCDMLLEDLASGAQIPISDDRGPGARGCRLDLDALTQVAAAVLRSVVEGSPRLLMLNKFGKIEADGGGMREAIAEALAREIPVLVGVPARNLDRWRAFAGPFALELAVDEAAVGGWLNAHGVQLSDRAPPRLRSATARIRI